MAPDSKRWSPLCCGDKRDEAAQGHLVLSGQSTPTRVSNTCTSTVVVSPETSAGKVSMLNWQGYYRAYVVYKMAHMHALGTIYGVKIYLKSRHMMRIDFCLSFSVLYRLSGSSSLLPKSLHLKCLKPLVKSHAFNSVTLWHHTVSHICISAYAEGRSEAYRELKTQ